MTNRVRRSKNGALLVVALFGVSSCALGRSNPTPSDEGFKSIHPEAPVAVSPDYDDYLMDVQALKSDANDQVLATATYYLKDAQSASFCVLDVGNPDWQTICGGSSFIEVDGSRIVARDTNPLATEILASSWKNIPAEGG